MPEEISRLVSTNETSQVLTTQVEAIDSGDYEVPTYYPSLPVRMPSYLKDRSVNINTIRAMFPLIYDFINVSKINSYSRRMSTNAISFYFHKKESKVKCGIDDRRNANMSIKVRITKFQESGRRSYTISKHYNITSIFEFMKRDLEYKYGKSMSSVSSIPEIIKQRVDAYNFRNNTSTQTLEPLESEELTGLISRVARRREQNINTSAELMREYLHNTQTQNPLF